MTEILIPKTTIIISGSSLNSVQACPTKDDYENVKLLRPLSTALVIDKGILMHKVLEVYYKFIRSSLPDPVNAAIIAGRKLAIELDLDIPESENVISHFIKYVEFYQGDGWTPVFVEESFSVVLYEDETLRILYEGTIDLVVDNVQSIRIVVDHKTGSRNKPPLGLSNQFRGYSLSLEADTIIINKVLFYKEGTEHKASDRFRRYSISYTSLQLEEWRQNTIGWAIYRYELMKKKRENPDFILPMNHTSCDKYGKCTFVPICDAVPGEPREYVINRMFKVVSESHDEERFKDDD